MKEYNLAKVALLFNVNRSTLRDAIARTEKEIERSVDNRGRPAALTDADVHRAPATLYPQMERGRTQTDKDGHAGRQDILGYFESVKNTSRYFQSV